MNLEPIKSTYTIDNLSHIYTSQLHPTHLHMHTQRKEWDHKQYICDLGTLCDQGYPLAQLPTYLQPQFVVHSISPRSNALKCSILPCIDLYIPQTEEMRRFICESRKKVIFFPWRKHALLLFSNRIMSLILLPLPETNTIWKKLSFLSVERHHFFSHSHSSLFFNSSITYCPIISRALFSTDDHTTITAEGLP